MQISGASSQSMSASLLSKANAKIFDELDTNKDGTVSLEEMQAGQASSKNGKTSDAQSVSDRFSSMDTDGDGAVTEQEGLAFLTAALSSDAMGSLLTAQATGQGQQPPAFEDIDSDGDGSITQAEMQNFGTTVMGDSDTTKADEIFSKMDINQDGTVSAEEKSSFDSQMKADGPKGPPPGDAPRGPPPSETASNETTETETTSTASSSNIQALLKELLAALQSVGLTSTADSAESSSTITATA